MRKTKALAVAAAMAVATVSSAGSSNAAVSTGKCGMVRVLAEAGFKGKDLRAAWSITWRESRHQNLGPGHPSFNGHDYGVWQFNQPTWGGKRWFTYSNMLDPVKQSRIAYRFTKGGRDWRHWGLREQAGRWVLDTTYYGSWSAWQHTNWIIGPFNQGWSLFPKGCVRA